MLNPHRLALLRHFRLDRRYVRGEGAWLRDAEGRRVLDFSSQYGAVPLGHNPPALWAAIDDVRREAVPAMVQPSREVNAEALAGRLAALAPVGVEGDEAVVTFAQSGAEAVEIAVRVARHATSRALVIGCQRGFHGRTLGASALTWKTAKSLRDDVRPPGFLHVTFNDVAALDDIFARRAGEIAALILEPIQGEGGVHEADPAWLHRARSLCTEHGALLVLDEIQTGLGRTGALFAAEASGVRADVMLLSKALGGGLVPLAACITARPFFGEEMGLGESSTFANNNLTCAVGLALIDELTRDDGALVKRARDAGDRLRSGLESLTARHRGVVRAVRGRGLLLGIELEPIDGDSSFLMRYLGEQEGMVALAASYLLNVHALRVIPCLTSGRVLRVQPPLNVTDAEIARALHAIGALLGAIEMRDWSALVRPVIGSAAAPAGALDRRPGGSAGGVPPRRQVDRPVLSAAPVTRDERPTRFAFLLHHTSPEDLVRTTPALRDLAPQDLRALYDWVSARPGHAPVCFLPSIRGAGGAVAQGWLIGLGHTPESMRERPRAEVADDIARAVDAAWRLGAQVVGLGAFTSIFSGDGANVASCPAAVTTGSALTVAMALAGIEVACRRVGLDPSRAHGLILGPGSVGGAAAALAAEVLPSLTIVANPERAERSRAKAEALMDSIYAHVARGVFSSAPRGVAATLAGMLARWKRLVPRGEALIDRLRSLSISGDERRAQMGLADEIATACALAGARAPIEVTLDIEDASASADVVIAASSASRPLILPHMLRPGAIVCDVAKPADVAASVRALRPDVLVFDGGLARYPEPISFGQNLGYEPGVNLACLTETVLLALESVTCGRFGFSRVGLLGEVARIRAAAERHGFGVADLRSDGRILGDADYEAVARAREGNSATETRSHGGTHREQPACDGRSSDRRGHHAA